MRGIRQALVLLAIASCGVGAAAAPPADLTFAFRPPAQKTLAYKVTATDKARFRGAEQQAQRHSHRLTVSFGAQTPQGVEARLAIREVKAEAGSPHGLDYLMARAAEDQSFDVIVAGNGLVRDMADWPAAKALLAGALPRVDPARWTENRAVVDMLDSATAANALARPFQLLGALYQLPFKSNGSITSVPDFMGPGAFVFAGRTARTRLVGRDRGRRTITAEWTLRTAPAIAAEKLAPQLHAMLRSISSSDVAAGGAETLLARLLKEGRIGLEEMATVVMDAQTRQVRRFQHELTIVAGDLRREQMLVMELQKL
jgi:hypothetical protein